MRKFLLARIIVMLVLPLFSFSFPETGATSSLVPFTPHEVKVLVVSPANTYWNGGHYLISDLARYGFNVTQHTSDDGTAVDYRNDAKTADLSQYDVVILHGGYFGFPPTTVTVEEVNHFTNYGGILIVIGNALFGNETTRARWDNFFASEPVLKLEQRLGVNFTDWLIHVGAAYYHNNGNFTLTDSSVNGLPSFINYVTAVQESINYQVEVTPKEANKIYDFTTEDGVTTSGVTYYKNATGVVGIYIQGSYIYAIEDPAGSRQIRYFGLTDTAKRSSLLASLIAFALDTDINTIVKPQPLASVRLDYLGRWGWDETYLSSSLSNFNSVVDTHDVSPTISFTDFPDFNPEYWNKTVPTVLSQLKSVYRDWEYSCSLRNRDTSSMSQSQIEFLIQDIKGNYTDLGMDQFSTVATLAGYWNQTTLDAMAYQNLYLLDMAGEPVDWGLDKYYADWWNSRIIFGVVVHSAAHMSIGWNYTDFTQVDPDPNVAKNILHHEYFEDRDKWALAVVNGFPSFVYNVWHFRRNEVGTYSLRTVCTNLTSEIPDIRFVPFVEAGLYFGNRWMSIDNPVREGSTIEFEVDSSAVPDVVSIGKGMLWLRIGTSETIQKVLINDEPWFYFDDHTIRLPADSVHVKVVLGESVDPTVTGTVYKVTETGWDGERFTVSVSAASGLNVSIRLMVPLLDAFCSEILWGYQFNATSQVLEFWAISDGSITFEVGADVTPPVMEEASHSPTWYNTSVTISVNITDLETDIGTAILGYSSDSSWINVTMVHEDGLYTAEIPAFRYGTVVRYRLYAFDNAGNWRSSEIFSYNVTDETPPEVGVPQWGPVSPSAGEQVLVRVSVGEPENASGIDTVKLWYYLHDDSYSWQLVEMTYENDLWWGEIPDQSEGTAISFLVRAQDKAGNLDTTTDYSYEVGGGGELPWYVLVAGLALTAGAVGVGLYFIKFRKTKREAKKPE